MVRSQYCSGRCYTCQNGLSRCFPRKGEDLYMLATKEKLLEMLDRHSYSDENRQEMIEALRTNYNHEYKEGEWLHRPMFLNVVCRRCKQTISIQVSADSPWLSGRYPGIHCSNKEFHTNCPNKIDLEEKVFFDTVSTSDRPVSDEVVDLSDRFR